MTYLFKYEYHDPVDRKYDGSGSWECDALTYEEAEERFWETHHHYEYSLYWSGLKTNSPRQAVRKSL